MKADARIGVLLVAAAGLAFQYLRLHRAGNDLGSFSEKRLRIAGQSR